MASDSKRSAVAMTGSWLDITTVSGFNDIANADVSIECLSPLSIQIMFGGSVPGANDSGGFWLFGSGKSCRGTAANIWARGPAGALVTVTKEA